MPELFILPAAAIPMVDRFSEAILSKLLWICHNNRLKVIITKSG